MVCFTCGKPIAHMWLDYLELVKKHELMNKTKPSGQTPEFLAAAELKLGRACCRRMFFAQHDMYTKVK